MSNLATITNNILADSGIDDINVIVSTGSYSNPAWITALAWTKITGAPSGIVTGTGTTNVVPKFTGTSTIGDSAISDNTNEVSITKRLFLNTGGQSILLTPNLGSSVNRIESSNLPLEITTLGSALRLAAGGVTAQLTLASTGVVTLTNLAGTGSRIVVADSSGNLSASSALSGYVQGSGTTNYLPKFTGASTIGNSNLINDASGNLGLGVTPSAWGSALRVIQGPNSDFVFTSRYPYVLSNGFFDTSWKYVNSEGASFYVQAAGQHQWFNAPSGTAGNAITFTQAMTLNASGNLLVGTTTDNGARLQVSGNSYISGDLRFGTDYAGSNTAILKWQNGSASIPNSLGLFTWGDARDIQIGGNNVYFRTEAGVNRMIITSSGNVGIGTTTPSTALHVVSNDNSANRTSPYNVATITATSANAPYNGFGTGLVFAATHYNGLVYNGARIRTVLNDNSIVSLGNSIAFDVTSTRGGTLTEAMKIDYNGNVGIGTTSPSDKLQMNGGKAIFATSNFNGTTAGGSVFVFSDDNNGGKIWAQKDGNQAWGYLALQPAGGNLLVGTTTDAGYKLDVFGDARFGDGNNFNPLIQFAGSGRVQTSPGYSFVGDLDTGMFNPNTGNTLAFATGGTERMRITSSGNVLIGTTTDNGQRLQVIGNTYSEGLHIATGQFVQGASATNTFYTFSNTSINRVFLITLRQSGSSANNVMAIGYTFGSSLQAYNIVQDNTNPVLLLTISSSGLGLRLTTASGYGTTTWDWTITQLK